MADRSRRWLRPAVFAVVLVLTVTTTLLLSLWLKERRDGHVVATISAGKGYQITERGVRLDVHTVEARTEWPDGPTGDVEAPAGATYVRLEARLVGERAGAWTSCGWRLVTRDGSVYAGEQGGESEGREPCPSEEHPFAKVGEDARVVQLFLLPQDRVEGARIEFSTSGFTRGGSVVVIRPVS